ncbi:hypothetical protein LUZ60_007235 [Juncus effusus]|nr:hypothetical protein LUZ60_007235 [Juncus effusus]
MHCFPVFLLYLLSIQTIGAYGCLQTERDALLEFKAGVNDSFHRLTSWRGEDCCTWAGIKCSNQTGHVVKLNLGSPSYDWSYNNSLSGEINPSLRALTDLKHLDLSYNNFSGSIFPKFVSSLRYLKFLNLSYTGLSGMIPSQLSNLSRLQYLDLSWNGLSGMIPPQLSNLSRLQYLNLRCADCFSSTNALTIANIWWLSDLTSLTYLDLSGINLQDSKECVKALNMIPSLETLNLESNNLTTIPSCLSTVNFTSLTSFVLAANNFNSRIPAWIGQLTSLRKLVLSDNLFFGPIPLNLFSNLGSLNSLFIYDSLEGPIPSLNNLHNLTYLFLGAININEDIKELLSKFSNEALGKLESLGLRNSNLIGNLTGCLNKMPNLIELLLDGNKLNGTIPAEIWKQSNFLSLSLSGNSFTGEISELHLTGLSKLEYLDLSSNFINITINSNWVPPFQLLYLDLSACKLGPAFPSWLHNQFKLFELNLSNSRISDRMPDWFWNLSSLYSMDLSSNRIRGRLPLSLDHLTELNIIQLSNNQFHGAIPALPSSLHTLDFSCNAISEPLSQEFEAPFLFTLILSNNLLNGSIGQSICGLISLGVLDLSSNYIHGDLPHCWPNTLQVANLANNKINGTIPSSISSLNMLSVLQLNNNSLTGLLPSGMQFCKNLSIIDLGENEFYGQIPEWLGETLPNLNILRLRSNFFHGNIPSQVVHHRNLQVLDLADNNLFGSIPQNLDNMVAMTSPNQDPERNSSYSKIWISDSNYYIANMVVYMKGLELEYSTSLFFLKSIDLSGNNLTGEIPQSITTLLGLINLNLSYNNLKGIIPIEIGKMQLLESLDFRMNELSGIIPQSLADMDFLAILNVSYNNLSGEIPTGDQLQNIFDPYIYIGNAYLCGFPLNRSCNPTETSHNYNLKDDDNDSDEILLYLFAVLGFGFGFWAFFSVLMFKRNWRYRLFQMVDGMFDRIYVFVMLYFARLRRDASE